MKSKVKSKQLATELSKGGGNENCPMRKLPKNPWKFDNKLVRM